MTAILDVDEGGQITLPEKWREELGSPIRRVIAFRSRAGIMLLPLNERTMSFIQEESFNGDPFKMSNHFPPKIIS